MTRLPVPVCIVIIGVLSAALWVLLFKLRHLF